MNSIGHSVLFVRFKTHKFTVTFVKVKFDIVKGRQEVTRSLEFGLTYFMTPKVTVTFVVGLT